MASASPSGYRGSARLDAEAQRAGYRDRAHREAYRREVQKAVREGRPVPPPPPGARPYRPQAPGTPGGRGHRAAPVPANRARDRWHNLGTLGGRVKTTSSARIAGSAIRGAGRRGKGVIVTIKAEVVKKYTDARQNRAGTEATLTGLDPRELQRFVEAAHGDVMEGIRRAFEATGDYAFVGVPDAVIIKEYPPGLAG